MKTVSDEMIRKVFIHDGDSPTDFRKYAFILHKIECPHDLRGVSIVSGTLEVINENRRYFSKEAFNLEQSEFHRLMVNIRERASAYNKIAEIETAAKGWKSERPLYELIRGYTEHYSVKGSFILQFFIIHLFRNMKTINDFGRYHESINAFRLSLSKEDFAENTLISQEIDEIERNLSTFREILKGDCTTQSLREYIRRLTHFYALDWNIRKRKPKKGNKQSFNKIIRKEVNTQIEKLYEKNEFIRTQFSDIKEYINEFNHEYINHGLCVYEEVPEIEYIEQNQIDIDYPDYQQQFISEYIDTKKSKHKSLAMTHKYMQANNINLLSRNLLQPHELHVLLTEIFNQKRRTIHGIDGKVIRQGLLLALFTGRNLSKLTSLKHIQYHDDANEGTFWL